MGCLAGSQKGSWNEPHKQSQSPFWFDFSCWFDRQGMRNRMTPIRNHGFLSGNPETVHFQNAASVIALSQPREVLAAAGCRPKALSGSRTQRRQAARTTGLTDLAELNRSQQEATGREDQRPGLIECWAENVGIDWDSGLDFSGNIAP